MAAPVILDYTFFLIFDVRYGQEGGTASVCQISSQSLEPRPRYLTIIPFFKMAAAVILDLKKFKLLKIRTV